MNTEIDKFMSLSSVKFLDQISTALPFGIMVADLNGNVFYRSSIFENWVPGLPIDNRLWLLQVMPYLIQEQSLKFQDITVTSILSDYCIEEIELEMGYDNNKIFFRNHYSPLFDDKDSICGLIETTENITPLKEMEKSLQHARRFETVGRLASGIAHDFNNILQVINGHSEMLLETRKDDHRISKSLEIILSSGQKASALTRQLLLFSRRQQGEYKQLNLGVLLVGMQKILTRMLGEDIILSLQCNDRNLYMDGDESQVEQIVMNLAINARDAMPEGGKINISVEACYLDESTRSIYPYIRDGKYICMQFSDSGCGIPQNILEHIFEPFFTTKETGRGTGLGLATVYSIIKQLQGFITVKSELNNGTDFMIYFPLSEAKKQADSVNPVFEPKPGANKKVLIVEDDENVREFTLQALSNNGYCVKCAANIKQAKAIIQSELFDLLFIDIVLPDGNGVVFLESLTEKASRTAFVLSSGYTEDKSQIKNTLLKGYTFLHKPFTINSLLQACTEAIQNKV